MTGCSGLCQLLRNCGITLWIEAQDRYWQHKAHLAWQTLLESSCVLLWDGAARLKGRFKLSFQFWTIPIDFLWWDCSLYQGKAWKRQKRVCFGNLGVDIPWNVQKHSWKGTLCWKEEAETSLSPSIPLLQRPVRSSTRHLDFCRVKWWQACRWRALKRSFLEFSDWKGKVAASQFHWWSFRAAADSQQHSPRGEDLCNLAVALLSSPLQAPELCFRESNLPPLQLIL